MANLVGPLNPTVQYIDPATGKFTQTGITYFSNLVAQVVSLQGQLTAQQAQLNTLQAKVEAL